MNVPPVHAGNGITISRASIHATPSAQSRSLLPDVVVTDFSERDAPVLYNQLAADRNGISAYLDYAKVVHSPEDLVGHVRNSQAAGMVVKTIHYKGEPVGMSEINVGRDEVDLVRSWNSEPLRGKNIMVAYLQRASEIFRAEGKSAIIGSIREDNVASNNWAKAVGGKLIRSYTNAEGTFNVYSHDLKSAGISEPSIQSKL